jgi:PAS domain S-box-containing protein
MEGAEVTVSWTPVVIVDVVGSILTVVIAVCCALFSREWTNKKPEDIFRHYIFLLTLAIVFFAISRSFGHLFKQILLFNNMSGLWEAISPFSGAINTATFIVIFAFGIYFHRFQWVNLQIEKYQNNLEALVADRTAELEQTTLTLKNVLDSANPICISGVDFELIQANKAYYSIWPKKQEDGENLKCFESRPGPFCNTDQCPLKQLVEGKEEVVVEMSKIKGNKTQEFIVTARPFRDANGKLIGVVESFQDITERKRTETALASERERLAVTLRSIGDGVITTDISGKIVLINKVAEQLTGWNQIEAVGRPIEEVLNIVDEKRRTQAENPVPKVIHSGRIIDLPYHSALISKNGEIRSIADSGAPIRDKDSKIIGVVVVFRDVTEKKRMEEELLKTKKLESIGVLAGGIAHDFNNILAAILGNIELALLDSSMGEKPRKLLSEAEKASLRAKDLTQQLLTFSKGGEPVKEASSLQEVVQDSANFVLHGKKVACEFHFPDDLWLVEIDRGQISQVVQNIIMNATDAMPTGGMIRVSCENIDSIDNINLSPNKKYVKISITDSGAGIAANVIDKIFDPYFSTKTKGNGLGLAISHSIITKHGGHIEAVSQPGEGTTFTIFLPAASKPPARIEQAEKSAETRPPAKILIMDDEEMVRNMAEEMLSRLGHEVVLAKDGYEAVRLYRESLETDKPIDLAIMDLTIPGGMGGKEAIKEILSANPEAKVIVSSGYSNDPVMSSFKDYGFSGAVVKPYQLEQLAKAINEVLS